MSWKNIFLNKIILLFQQIDLFIQLKYLCEHLLIFSQKKNHQDCDGSSTRDKLFLLYEHIVTTLFKGYTMVVLAYRYKKVTTHNEEGNYFDDTIAAPKNINKENQ